MKCVFFFSNLNILIPQKHGGRRERGKKWDWETNNSINKSFSSNVVPGRFLMDEIKHFHLHLPPDRARINPSSWSAELRHQTDTARAETAADTSLSLSPPALTAAATTTTASPETCSHLKLPIFGALPFGSERTLTLGLREADLLLLLLLLSRARCPVLKLHFACAERLVHCWSNGASASFHQLRCLTFSPAGPTLLLCGG